MAEEDQRTLDNKKVLALINIWGMRIFFEIFLGGIIMFFRGAGYDILLLGIFIIVSLAMLFYSPVSTGD